MIFLTHQYCDVFYFVLFMKVNLDFHLKFLSKILQLILHSKLINCWKGSRNRACTPTITAISSSKVALMLIERKQDEVWRSILFELLVE